MKPGDHHPSLNQKYDIFQCPLCSSIGMEEREAFLTDVKFKLKRFGKNDVIITQGSQYNELYILIKGEVHTEMADEKGDFMHIGAVKAPNPLAIGFLFATNNTSPVTAIAQNDAMVIAIPKENVYSLMRKYDAFMMAFLGYISNKVAFLSEKLRLVSLRTIKAKLAYYLLKESKGENAFSLKVSKENVARLFGVSRPALVNVMMQMMEEGFIRVDKRKVEIVDRTALHKLC